MKMEFYLEEKCGFCKEKLFSFLPPVEHEELKYCCLECLNDSLELKKLKIQYELNSEANKAGHDMAVMMRSLGVSPKYMVMYNESIGLIKEYEDKIKEELE